MQDNRTFIHKLAVMKINDDSIAIVDPTAHPAHQISIKISQNFASIFNRGIQSELFILSTSDIRGVYLQICLHNIMSLCHIATNNMIHASSVTHVLLFFKKPCHDHYDNNMLTRQKHPDNLLAQRRKLSWTKEKKTQDADCLL